MLGNEHVRFGRRAAETDQSKDRHRAPARPHTEHPTREGKLYCAVVLDVHARRVVGWSIDATQTAALAANALGMAIANRNPRPSTEPGSGTVIHSDHGVQFTSWAFTRRAQESGLVPSMGSIGDCYDTQSRMIVTGLGLGGLTRATTGGDCLRVDLSAAVSRLGEEDVERAVTR